jgi:hypothetical protein
VPFLCFTVGRREGFSKKEGPLVTGKISQSKKNHYRSLKKGKFTWLFRKQCLFYNSKIPFFIRFR